MPDLIGIAIARKIMGTMEELPMAEVSVENGIEGDARGRKRGRQVTVLFEDDWKDACKDINEDLHWINRRANLFVNGYRGPQEEGSIIKIGDVKLKICSETDPCEMMDKTQIGLRKVLEPNWRGGVCCTVISAGKISLGDKVNIKIS